MKHKTVTSENNMNNFQLTPIYSPKSFFSGSDWVYAAGASPSCTSGLYVSCWQCLVQVDPFFLARFRVSIAMMMQGCVQSLCHEYLSNYCWFIQRHVHKIDKW